MRTWLFVQFYNHVLRHISNRKCKRLWTEAGYPEKFEPDERLNRKEIEEIRELMA